MKRKQKQKINVWRLISLFFPLPSFLFRFSDQACFPQARPVPKVHKLPSFHRHRVYSMDRIRSKSTPPPAHTCDNFVDIGDVTVAILVLLLHFLFSQFDKEEDMWCDKMITWWCHLSSQMTLDNFTKWWNYLSQMKTNRISLSLLHLSLVWFIVVCILSPPSFSAFFRWDISLHMCHV